MNDKYLTVTQINKYIKYKFDNDQNLNIVYLKGEISNFKSHSSGHLYFTIKDESSRIMAVMFRNNAMKINFKPNDGDKVLVVGKIGVYEASGNYQIYVEEMALDGVGNLYLEFEKLKKKLELEGLFDQKYKKPIPKYPKNIGVITATTGAAIRDIITTINRRYKLVNVSIFPCLVQGDGAKEDIVRNLNRAQDYDLDVIILGRGGGSIEDLWAFNEECVARAIFDSKIPIISGVGHEIDFTISDFVSDLRAPTPTAAAELAVPNTLELINALNQLNIRCNKSVRNLLDMKKQQLKKLTDSYILKNPKSMYEVKMQKVDGLVEKILYLLKYKVNESSNELLNVDNRLKISIGKTVDLKNNKFLNIITKLEALNPINTIKRGYTITKNKEKCINNINNVKVGDIIETELVNGKLFSEVKNVEVKE